MTRASNVHRNLLSTLSDSVFYTEYVRNSEQLNGWRRGLTDERSRPHSAPSKGQRRRGAGPPDWRATWFKGSMLF